MNRPAQGLPWKYEIGLRSQANSHEFLVNPTIVSGEFTLAIDGGAPATLGTVAVISASNRVGIEVAAGVLDTCVEGFTIRGKDANDEWDEYFEYFPIKKLQQDVYDVTLFDVAGNELPGLDVGTIVVETSIDGAAWSGAIAGRTWVDRGYGMYVCTNGLPLANVKGNVVMVRVKAPLSEPTTITLGEVD